MMRFLDIVNHSENNPNDFKKVDAGTDTNLSFPNSISQSSSSNIPPSSSNLNCDSSSTSLSSSSSNNPSTDRSSSNSSSPSSTSSPPATTITNLYSNSKSKSNSRSNTNSFSKTLIPSNDSKQSNGLSSKQSKFSIYNSINDRKVIKNSKVNKLYKLIPKCKIHKTVLQNKNLIQLAIRRKLSAPKNGSNNDIFDYNDDDYLNEFNSNSKLHLRSLESGLRVKLTLVPSLLTLYKSLIPHNNRNLSMSLLKFDESKNHLVSNSIYDDGELLKIFTDDINDDKSENKSKLKNGKLITKKVQLIDNNISNSNNNSNNKNDIINITNDNKNSNESSNSVKTKESLPTFNSLSESIKSLFNVDDYTLIRVTRSTTTGNEGSVLLKLETAKPGDYKLFDDFEFLNEMIHSIGLKDATPNNLFIKKIVARPRYKSDMKIFLIPKNSDLSLYVDERMFERDLINGVIDFEKPLNKRVYCTFNCDEILSNTKKLIESSKIEFENDRRLRNELINQTPSDIVVDNPESSKKVHDNQLLNHFHQNKDVLNKKRQELQQQESQQEQQKLQQQKQHELQQQQQQETQELYQQQQQETEDRDSLNNISNYNSNSVDYRSKFRPLLKPVIQNHPFMYSYPYSSNSNKATSHSPFANNSLSSFSLSSNSSTPSSVSTPSSISTPPSTTSSTSSTSFPFSASSSSSTSSSLPSISSSTTSIPSTTSISSTTSLPSIASSPLRQSNMSLPSLKTLDFESNFNDNTPNYSSTHNVPSKFSNYPKSNQLHINLPPPAQFSNYTNDNGNMYNQQMNPYYRN